VSLADDLAGLALDHGAAGFGICDAGAFADTRSDIEDAINSGRSAGLTFTFNDPGRSTDVRRSFPWARSLVVLAHGYPAPVPGSPDSGVGRIAAFAADDHYRPLRAALREVAGALRDQGCRAEVLADDNRLVDRAAAVRAGVGWWGKSAMVLVPGHGPWVLLGSVVTDADLPARAPMRRGCGTCDACIPACPTGAIVAPGVLDARRCLAQWAQAPGWIPVELRRSMGDRIYGCDECLVACPPGARAPQAARAASLADLVGLLGSDDATLGRRYQRFYLPGNEIAPLRRNALVALGNTAGERAVAVVAGYAGHRDPMLRGHAVWALGRLGGARARAVLQAVAGGDDDAAVRAEAEAALTVTLA
jgi:epoxyqueuosine reductase